MNTTPSLTKLSVSVSLKTSDGYSSRDEYTSTLRGCSSEETLLGAVDELIRIATLYGVGEAAMARAVDAASRTKAFLASRNQ